MMKGDLKKDFWEITWEAFKVLDDCFLLFDQSLELIDYNAGLSEFEQAITTSENKSFNSISNILSANYILKEIKNAHLAEAGYKVFRGESIRKKINALGTPLESEIDNTQILDSMSDGSVLIDTGFKIKYANKKFKEQYPKYIENQKDQLCYKVIHNMDNPCMNCSIDIIKKTRQLHRTVRSVKNGPSILTMTYPVYDKNNQLAGAVITYRDISESKNIEKALKKEASINRVIAEIAQNILLPELSEENIAKRILLTSLSITKSSTGFVSAANNETKNLEWKAFENYSLKTQYKGMEPCHKSDNVPCINNFIKAKKVPFLSNHLKSFLKENQILECTMTRENCLMVPAIFNNELIGQIYVSGSDRPYNETDIEVLKQLSSLYALSIYRRNSEIDLINAKEEAEENNKLKSAFLANMSHEIRTPMNSINGFSELLQNTTQPPDKQRYYLDMIYKSSNQLLKIINNILDISKLEVGQAKVTEKEYDINQIIIESLHTIAPDFNTNDEVEIKTLLPLQGSESYVLCDGSRLQQILTNLIQNALKFTSYGIIEIGYQLNEKFIQFHVKDTGIGIAPEKHHLVFERFGQAEEGYSRNFEGAGLGLSICKGFVELMGGNIWFDSKPNIGSSFYFTIPYKPTQAPVVSVAPSVEPTIFNWKNKKILLVEDESFSQSYIETIILPFGVKIIYAGDGFEALNQVRLNPDIDLILMDIRLPRLDGIEATKKIRLLGFTKPIIAQTANALNEDKKTCLKAGCSNFIAKPINRIEFTKLLNEYLGQ
ncbi:MAG TPA: hypothetical protein DCQ26_12415 [Marinilabiliales bacterium]|nr:MAG: hypothetical protein A2W88_06210 [Bacteroidetes bacterium GWF2_40_13]OFZ24796.1 MAG: hypothetical protein A2437_15775 [Bacteroidetes bacterium RIFOXYC2_FULL_40_12]HAM99403.1 hypothetical protein [Marinilabiliales bacterium]HBO73209.1 hypothetical protein [Marinilabiliales bacterium]HBX85166.1 hypothetical protein [Marinilabiliales bacterium]